MPQLKEKGRGLIFLADNFLYGAFGDNSFDADALLAAI